MIDFEPEIESQLKGRYFEAVAKIYDAVEISKDPETRPGKLRKHVFDFFDGCRMIVSKERMPNGKVVLHFSASFQEGYGCGDDSLQGMLGVVLDKAQELRGESFKGNVSCVLASGSIIHLIYEENQIVPLPGTNPLLN